MIYNDSPSWTDDASCVGHDPELWSLSDDLRDRDANKKRFETAEIICSTCPVFSECWEAATEEDKQWTMRAGAWPTEWSDAPAGRPRSGRCQRGHDTSDPASRRKDGSCIACIMYYRTRKTCDEGHDLTTPGARRKGGACKACYEARQDRYHRTQRMGLCRNGHDLSKPGATGSTNKCLQCRRDARKSRANNTKRDGGSSGIIETTARSTG